MQTTRKLALSLLDWWYGMSLKPLEEWRTEYFALQTELKRVREKIDQSQQKIKNFNADAPTSDVYADYYVNKERLNEILLVMRTLNEDENNRAWYHAMRRQLVS